MFVHGNFRLDGPICKCLDENPDKNTIDIYGWSIRFTQDGPALVISCRLCQSYLFVQRSQFHMAIQVHGYPARTRESMHPVLNVVEMPPPCPQVQAVAWDDVPGRGRIATVSKEEVEEVSIGDRIIIDNDLYIIEGVETSIANKKSVGLCVKSVQ